jgi:aminoglycoside phosphotransferase family enzyme/predicted kinase
MSDASKATPAPKLVEALLEPDPYPHGADKIELIETHISWVFLAGDYAYKIKKPVALGFLDFRELASRHFYCEEEIRLNRPWAPEIYVDVVAITFLQGRMKIGGAGPAVEYAVRMRRFDQALRLDKQLECNQLSPDDMRGLAANIAQRHASAERVPASGRRRALDLTESLMWDNFTALRPATDNAKIDQLFDWTGHELEKLRLIISERFDEGFYRDCHGDLHLANLVRLPGGITTFDCIEFSADLRFIDVACDIAFLIMDLESKQRDDLAAYFMNRYLEKSDDYASMQLFDLYFVYRCLVRAKVAAIRATERSLVDEARQDSVEAKRYITMATRQAKPRRPILVMMHGLSGSGKTWVSERLMAQLPAIRIRSDLLRKRLFGYEETAKSDSAIAQGIYNASSDTDVYAGMRNRAEAVLRSGHNVILDATFLRRESRDDAAALARHCGAALVIVFATASDDELRRRLLVRGMSGADASEADLAVLDHQLRLHDPLTGTERDLAIQIDSRDAGAVSDLPQRIRQRQTHSFK